MWKAILARRPLPRNLRDAADQLEKLQPKFQKAWEQANILFTEPAARAAATRQHREHGAELAEGKEPTGTRTYEQWTDDYSAKQSAAKQAMEHITAAAVPFAQPLAEWFAVQAREVAEEVEKAEEKTFKEFGVPYSPSPLVLTLRKLADQARARIPTPGHRSTDPKQLCPFLFDL